MPTLHIKTIIKIIALSKNTTKETINIINLCVSGVFETLNTKFYAVIYTMKYNSYFRKLGPI
jgi:hypothetical protein